MTRKFLQIQEQSLAGAGAGIGDTTLILKSFNQIDGTGITSMTDTFGNKAFATLEPGKGRREEQISFTGLVVNSDGTVSLTGVSSVTMDAPYTESAGLTKQHAGGVAFIISNTSGFYSEFIIAGDDYEIDGEFNFKTQPKITIDDGADGDPDDPVDPQDIPTKFYVDKEITEATEDKLSKDGGTMSGDIDMDGNKITNLPEPTEDSEASTKNYVDEISVAGAPNAGLTTKGLVQEATQEQIDEGTDTGDTGARLFVTPSKIPALLTREFTTDETWTPITGLTSDTIFQLTSDTTAGRFKVFIDSVLNNITEKSVNLFKVTSSVVIEAIDIISNIDEASYSSKSFSVSSQETSPRSVAFNTDGTTMFIVGTSTDTVYQYTLSTGFDVSTASYSSKSFSVSSQDTSPLSVAFNTDGTTMLFLGSSDTVYQYTLSTGFDVSTASYSSKSFSVSSQDTIPQSVAFNTDGTKMFIVGRSSDTVYQYSIPLSGVEGLIAIAK